MENFFLFTKFVSEMRKIESARVRTFTQRWVTNTNWIQKSKHQEILPRKSSRTERTLVYGALVWLRRGFFAAAAVASQRVRRFDFCAWPADIFWLLCCCWIRLLGLAFRLHVLHCTTVTRPHNNIQYFDVCFMYERTKCAFCDVCIGFCWIHRAHKAWTLVRVSIWPFGLA